MTIRLNSWVGSSAVLVLALAASDLSASLIVDKASVIRPTVVNFNNYPFQLYAGTPIQIGGAVGESIFWSAAPGGVITPADAAFNGRGYWRALERGNGITAPDVAAQCAMTYDFGTHPVSSVGFFMNYAIDWPVPSTGVWIEALDASGAVLESHNIFVEAPIVVGQVYLDAGGFRGIARSRNDIVQVRVRSDGSYFALDDFTFSRVRRAEDFNGDGQSDLLWQDSATGARYLWLMNGTVFGSSLALGTVSMPWQIAGTADFDADGKPDIVWQNAVTGERSIWLMNGGAFKAAVNLGVISTSWQIAGTGDFDGDGKPDLLWQNTITGERCIWLMQGTTYGGGVSLGAVSPDWQIAGTGDLNGDGMPDIIWQNTSTGDRYVWLMNGTTVTSGVFLGTVPTQWQIVGAGEYNGDGQIDLLWQNASTGDRYVWLMNGTALVSSVFLGNIPAQWRMGN